MGRDMYEAYPAFAAVIDAADAAVDFDLKTLMFEGPDDQLNLTEYTQPCMVAFACGMTAVLAECGIEPDYVAGLSLGEYSALAGRRRVRARRGREARRLPRCRHGERRCRPRHRDDFNSGPRPRGRGVRCGRCRRAMLRRARPSRSPITTAPVRS